VWFCRSESTHALLFTAHRPDAGRLSPHALVPTVIVQSGPASHSRNLRITNTASSRGNANR
jgi:hypothetical protein